MKKAIVFLLALAGLGAGGFKLYNTNFSREAPPDLRTEPVKRGELVATIGATGTVEPVDVVDVGAQVVGRIRDLGLDPAELKGKKFSDFTPEQRAKMRRIDYGSVVHEGTELAYIDDSVYGAQLAQAKAQVSRAEADLQQFNAKVEQTRREWERARSLHELQIESLGGAPIKGISDADYDLARANYEVAQASLAVGRAAVEQAHAALDLAQTNVNYTVIKSPVEGVIIDRRVNIGQTVVASLNAPSLFLIAKDLSKMQVWASVNEADIGRIRSREKMPVQFTVDAFPDRTFRGAVGQVRLNAQMTQNVVTYTVVVDFDNSDLTLLPYLTANLKFETERHSDALLVPNSALRWKPRPELIAPEYRDAAESPGAADGKPAGKGRPPGAKGEGRPAAAGTDRPADKPNNDRGRVWVKEEGTGFVRPIDVKVGATDGATTVVSGDGLEEGMDVVVREMRVEKSDGDTKNPFAPPAFRKNRDQPKGPQ